MSSDKKAQTGMELEEKEFITNEPMKFSSFFNKPHGLEILVCQTTAPCETTGPKALSSFPL